MAQYNDLSVLDGITKRVYGKGVHQAVPDNVKMFFDLFPFSASSERLGNLFAEAVNLSIEQGVTRTSGTAGVVTLNNSVASVMKQCVVDGASLILQATIAWDLVSKARSPNSAQAFENALTQIVDNTLLSHRRHQVADMLYGGDDIGIIQTGTAGATQTITKASCAAGIYYGSNNMLVDVYDATLATKRNASPLSLVTYNVDPSGANRTLTFNTSVTTTTGDRVVFAGTVAAQSFITPAGLSIISGMQGGTLFGLSQVTYPVFQGCVYDAGGSALNMQSIDKAAILPLIRGYTGKMKLLVNPLTFSNIAMEEVARIQLVGSQVSGSAKVGYDEVQFVTAAGANITCQPSPWIKEGLGFLVPNDGTVKRVGSVDIQLGGPADPAPTWRRIEGQTGYSLPTFSLSAMFSAEPWKCVLIKNIVNT